MRQIQHIDFEEALNIAEKYKNEELNKRLNRRIKELKQNEKSKKFTQPDELAEKRNKKREKNRGKNEYNKQYKENRKIVLILDNYKCRECGSRENLHVHHIKERCKGGTNDINNLVTLCGGCHKEKHNGENVYKIMNA